jgi:type VI protein secretion system component Hcp
MRRFFLFVAVALGLVAAPALADGSFVKIGNINGYATEAQHQGWIQIGSFGQEERSWSFSISTFKYEPSRKVFWFEKVIDASSPALQKALVARTRFPQVMFDVAVRTETFRTTLYEVKILSIETKGNREKITLDFKRQHDTTFIPPR